MSEKLLIIVLAASLSAGGLRPAAVAHSHAGGDRPHEHHDSAGGAPHSHGHTHGHHHHGGAEHQQADESRNGLRESVPHRHLTVWLWDFALPELPSPEDGSEQGDPPAVVRLVDLPALPSAEAGPGWAISGDSSGVPRIESLIADSARPDRCADAPRTLLCDAARRERSGVLLT